MLNQQDKKKIAIALRAAVAMGVIAGSPHASAASGFDDIPLEALTISDRFNSDPSYAADFKENANGVEVISRDYMGEAIAVQKKEIDGKPYYLYRFYDTLMVMLEEQKDTNTPNYMVTKGRNVGSDYQREYYLCTGEANASCERAEAYMDIGHC